MKMKGHQEELIKKRLSGGEALLEYKRKCHTLRRITAGDWGDYLGGGQIDPDQDKWRSASSEFFDILVRDFTEARANYPLKTAKTLALKVAYQMPEIEYPELSQVEPNVQTVNETYDQVRLGECDAHSQMGLTLWDALVGGLGWSLVGVRDGKPIVINVDMLDVKWDIFARTPRESEWCSRIIRAPLYKFKEWYPNANFSSAEDEKTGDLGLFEAEEYWDFETKALFPAANDRSSGERGDAFFIEETDYPDEIPMKPLYFYQLPSVRQPIGVVEMVVGHAIALIEAEDTLRDVVKRMKPFYLVKEGTMDEDQFQKFLDGEIAAAVKSRDASGIQFIAGGEVSRTVLEYAREQREAVIQGGGGDPYALGGRVEGIQYASEVNAIRGSSDLVSAYVSKVNAEYWQDVVACFHTLGSRWDSEPFKVMVGGVEIEFDEMDQISSYLKTGMKPIIRENSMQFRSKEEKIMEAAAGVELALKAAGAVGPMAVLKAYEDFLRQSGVKNISERLQSPMPMALPGGAMQGEQALGATMAQM